MIYYLTYNDAPSGIYSSQVIDVIKYLNAQFNANVKLVAFISLRGFLLNRRRIKDELPDSMVLPMFPGVGRWRKNLLLLNMISFVAKPRAIISRSVLATNLSLLLKMKNKGLKIIYDGRGAIEAEWNEYKVITDKLMLAEIHTLEKNAILNSDFRIAVSNKLVEFWKTEFKYAGTNHIVIPCTLNGHFETADVSAAHIYLVRNELGLTEDDVVFVYSGSTAGWQSFDLLFSFIVPILEKSKKNKIVFFSKMDKGILKLNDLFPGQVICRELFPNEVSKYLVVGNYGLLIREKSITNRVASPVKFAEYLACGLNVIISEGIGDYSEFAAAHGCGQLVNEFYFKAMDKPALQLLAKTNFTKSSKFELYKRLTHITSK